MTLRARIWRDRAPRKWPKSRPRSELPLEDLVGLDVGEKAAGLVLLEAGLDLVDGVLDLALADLQLQLRALLDEEVARDQFLQGALSDLAHVGGVGHGRGVGPRPIVEGGGRFLLILGQEDGAAVDDRDRVLHRRSRAGRAASHEV